VADARMLLFFQDPSALTLMILSGLGILGIFLRSAWCRYLCPYGALLGLLSWASPAHVRRDEETCVQCKRCSASCPGGIRVHTITKVRSPECVGCMRCQSVCPVPGCVTLRAGVSENMLFSGLAALGFSLLAAWLLARHLLAPISDLARAARQIAGGALDTRIQVRSEDELGQLAADFNDMAERLGRVEESRRAWISESSHELRTPLAVLRAEIEAMQDGVRTPNAATLARLHKQVQQLTKLVDDLRLTLDREPAEGAMERELVAWVAPVAVLEEAIETFRERYDAANIRLDSAQLVDAGWQLRGDAGRLLQVFGNLLENSLRYTHAGGQLRIGARASTPQLLLEFDDSAPAPPAAALPRLFERFFRAEPSRSRAFGGSGLGLAICRTLVEAHGGQISATPSALGGLKICIELPLEKP